MRTISTIAWTVFLASPVALQFYREGDPADRLAAGLDHAVKAGAVGLG